MSYKVKKYKCCHSPKVLKIFEEEKKGKKLKKIFLPLDIRLALGISSSTYVQYNTWLTIHDQKHYTSSRFI